MAARWTVRWWHNFEIKCLGGANFLRPACHVSVLWIAERSVYDRVARAQDFFFWQIDERGSTGVPKREMPELNAAAAVADHVRTFGIRLLRRLRSRLVAPRDTT